MTYDKCMDPFIVNPLSYDKTIEFDRAKDYCFSFLAMNGIDRPKVIHVEKTKLSAEKNSWRDHGWFEWYSREMYVNLKGSKVPTKTPGFSWSYTGYRADMTAPGVLAHEMGHMVHSDLEKIYTRKKIMADLKKLVKCEAPVTSYEPNLYETFAESMRLFIMNPSLLEQGRPGRFFYLTSLGLKPPHSEDWQTVLQNAHPKFITAAKNWISK